MHGSRIRDVLFEDLKCMVRGFVMHGSRICNARFKDLKCMVCEREKCFEASFLWLRWYRLRFFVKKVGKSFVSIKKGCNFASLLRKTSEDGM